MENTLSHSNYVRVTRAQRLLCKSNDPCSFTGYKCSQARVEGFEYCFRHILEDKSSPFCQCSFIYKNSKRCFRPASKSDRKDNCSLCPEHSRQNLRKRQKSLAAKSKMCSPQTCLNQLSHHLQSSNSSCEAKPKPSSSASVAVLNDVSMDDDSIPDVRLLVRAEDDSELDSADSDVDYLEHAGVFTTDEASSIYLQKLQKLKKLYNQEFSRLFWVLKEGRRKYIKDIKTEKETMSNIHDQPKSTCEERELYQELKALSRYHRSLGKEALLYKQMTEKKLQASEGFVPKTTPINKCSYNEGSWRCGVKCVPLSRFCFKHILQDEKQVLFQACGVSQPGGDNCGVPLFLHPLSGSKCVYHTSCSDAQLSKLSDENEAHMMGSCSLFKPKVIDFSDNGSLVISEVPEESISNSLDPQISSKEIVNTKDLPNQDSSLVLH